MSWRRTLETSCSKWRREKRLPQRNNPPTIPPPRLGRAYYLLMPHVPIAPMYWVHSVQKQPCHYFFFFLLFTACVTQCLPVGTFHTMDTRAQFTDFFVPVYTHHSKSTTKCTRARGICMPCTECSVSDSIGNSNWYKQCHCRSITCGIHLFKTFMRNCMLWSHSYWLIQLDPSGASSDTA